MINLEDIYNFNYVKIIIFFQNKYFLNNFLLEVFNSKVFKDIQTELYNNK
jgi:hypothetical protein